MGLDPFFGASRGGCLCPFAPVMAECGYLFLRDKDLAAYRAMLTFRLSGFRAGRSYRRVSRFGVTECVNQSVFRGTFPGELKYAWDNRFSKNPKLIMILCGSVSSWIDKKILKSRGFVGRPSLNLLVPELSMRECAAFWRRGGCKVSSTERSV